MGVFDYIRCEYPLPGLEDPTGIDFQTKDTEHQSLDTYIITPQGRLMDHIATRFEEVEHQEDSGIPSRFPCARRRAVEFEDVDTNHHGWLRFYGNVENNPEREGLSISRSLRMGASYQ